MGIWSPKNHYLNQVGFEQHQDQPKRISTSAGHRLTVILENGTSDIQTAKAREKHRDSVRKSGLSVILADVPEDRGASAHSSGYSYNVWSENEKFAALRNHKQIAKRGGWRRLLIILAIILLLIIALGVGLGVGLKNKKFDRYAISLIVQHSLPANILKFLFHHSHHPHHRQLRLRILRHSRLSNFHLKFEFERPTLRLSARQIQPRNLPRHGPDELHVQPVNLDVRSLHRLLHLSVQVPGNF